MAELFPISLTNGMSVDYMQALETAAKAGHNVLSDGFGASTKQDVVGEFLRNNSLTKFPELTADMAPTTVHRLRNALADAYESGGTYEDLVQAVTNQCEGLTSVQAGMIAQTEMNAAYNFGRKQLGLDIGANEKSWNSDGTTCCEILAHGKRSSGLDSNG